MQFSNELERKPNDDRLYQWAHLEGKSNCMADDLTHEVEPSNASPGAARWLCFWVLAILSVFFIVMIAVETFDGPTPVNEKPRLPAPQTDLPQNTQ